MIDKRCSICDRLIPKKRLHRVPRAVTCKTGPCQTEHEKRLAAHASMHYQRRRRAALKRWRQTTGHAYAHTAEQVAWANALERLCEPAAVRAAPHEKSNDR